MIAFLIDSLDVRGGTHKQFLKLLQYTEAQGEDFCIITYNVDYDKTYPGFGKYSDKIHIIPDARLRVRKPIQSFRNIINARKALKDLLKDITVVNIHDCGMEMLFPALSGKKVIWQVNDLPSVFSIGASQHQKQNIKTKLLKRVYLSYLKYIDKFTVNVSKNKERIRDIFHRDAEVLYCGIEPIGINHDTGTSFENFRTKTINLLSSGVWFPYRNYETQVEIVKLLVDRGYDVSLNIIGSTQYSHTYHDKIKKMIDEQCLSDRIKICGMVDEERFRQLHEQADMFLFINVDQSWGLAVFEAMSCGIPVIVSESVGATEILHDGVDSIFVNPLSAISVADKIIELATDRQLYSGISSTASKFHENYTWDNAYSSKMFALLQKLSDKPATGRQ